MLALWIPDASPQAVGLNCERRRSLTVAKRPLASSEEKREPASDINTAVVDSLKVLDPKRPIREADMERTFRHFRVGPCVDGSWLARVFFASAALVGAAMCSAFERGTRGRWP